MNQATNPTRRLAAVLFADIVGFTSLSSRDESASLRVVEHFERTVRDAAESQGGTVVKFMGDGALAHFPSTEAAVRAALRIRLSCADAPVRIGIHIGDILVRADADVLGDGVNIASRIQSLAKPGQVVVSDDVWRQLRHVEGFRFTALGSHHLKGVSEKRAVYAVDAHLGATQAPRAKRGGILLLGAAALVAVVSFFAWWQVNRGAYPVVLEATTETPTPVRSIVVLPFDDLSGDPDQAYFVAGMHDALIGELTELGSLRVISRTSAMRYLDSPMSLAEIAGELNVEAVVAAAVLRAGDRIRIRAELVRVLPEEQSLWAGTFDRELRDVLAMHSDVAKAITEAIRLSLTPGEQARLARAQSVDPVAYEAYLKGRFHWDLHTAADLDLALRHFEQSLERDPANAAAWGGIALTWLGRMQMRSVGLEEGSEALRAAATRALELDPVLASAHHALATDYAFYRHDWMAAEHHYLAMLEGNPGYALGRAFYSLFLRIRGKAGESIVQSSHALAEDPFNPIVQAMHMGNLSAAGQPGRALELLQRSLEQAPSHPILLRSLPLVYLQLDRYEEAYHAFLRHYTVAGDSAMVHALRSGKESDGHRGALTAMAREYERRVEDQILVNLGHITQLWTWVGDHERAIEWAERAVEAGDFGVPYFSTNRYNALRTHPRFNALLERLRLP